MTQQTKSAPIQALQPKILRVVSAYVECLPETEQSKFLRTFKQLDAAWFYVSVTSSRQMQQWLKKPAELLPKPLQLYQQSQAVRTHLEKRRLGRAIHRSLIGILLCALGLLCVAVALPVTLLTSCISVCLFIPPCIYNLYSIVRLESEYEFSKVLAKVALSKVELETTPNIALENNPKAAAESKSVSSCNKLESQPSITPIAEQLIGKNRMPDDNFCMPVLRMRGG